MKYRAVVMKIFYTCFLLLTGMMCINAQESPEPLAPNKAKLSTATRGFTLRFGSFETDRLSWQINGMLGYGFNKNNANRSNILGVFGSSGYTTKGILNQMLIDQAIVVTDLTSSKYYGFYQLEAGVLIGEILRLSTGLGVQHYATTSKADEQLYYMSSTAGLSFAVDSSVNWVFDVNFMHGRDFNNTVIRFSTGLNIAF
jgi:hypothetical protein